MVRLLVGGATCVCGAAWPQAPNDPLALWEQATVYRDEWGTPHVYGENVRALAFAFGYAQAEDHLEPMLAAYRIANGRAAEVFGEYYAESDEFSLKMGHAALARNVFPSLDPLTRDLCEGFAFGVNAWLVEHADRVPAWADGVKPEDVLALFHCYVTSFAPFDLPGVYHRQAAAFSGNAWAVAPSRSESGEPLLAINPHTYYDSPFRWYEAHLVCQDLNVAGATLFGLPVILQGHNESLGWALTPNQPDFADVYIDPGATPRRNPRNVNTPLLPGEEKILQAYLLSNARTYYVNTPNGPVERSVPCVDTPRGPLIGTDKGRLCVYCVGGYRDFGALAQLVEMGRARSLAAFQTALGMHQLPCFHVVYADREGNIFYLYNVKTGNKAVSDAPPLPPPKEGEEPKEEAPPEAKQPKIIDWTTPVLSGNPLFDWGELIPVGALPSLLNPASGYVQACGSPPWAATADSGMKAEQFPSWFAHDRDTYRAQRVRRLLEMGKRSFRDCQGMLYDTVSSFALEAAPRIVEAAEQHADFVANAHPDLGAGIDALKAWNGVASADSAGMTFFHAWWTALRAQSIGVFKTEESLFAALKENAEATQELTLNAANEAARVMRNEFDSLSVPWGEVHTITRGKREVALSGSATGEPIFTASDFVFERRKWRVTYGYGFAMVVSFGDKPAAVSVAPFGASEDPQSAHFDDQLDLLAKRRFKQTDFQHEDVQRNAASVRGCRMYLRPKGMEAVFTIHAPAPVEVRMITATEPPEDPPQDLVPFTLFATMEKLPHAAAMSTHIEIAVPAVLCARENLDKLAVYAHDAQRHWVRLDAQQVDRESRTFAADDAQGPATYVVLGPVLYRAERVATPEQNEPRMPETPAAPPPESTPSETGNTPAESAAPAASSVADETDKPRKKSRVTWGGPPRRPAKPPDLPQEDELPTFEPPKLDLQLPQDTFDTTKPASASQEKSVKTEGSSEKKTRKRKQKSVSQDGSSNVKRNFNLAPPSQQKPEARSRKSE